MKSRIGITALMTVGIVGLLSWSWAVSAEKEAASSSEVRLSKPDMKGGMSLTEALAKRRSTRAFAKKTLTPEEISQLCWAADGVSDEASGKRTAPSAMAQYPINVYVVDATGHYEYQPKTHSLKRLEEGDMLEKLRGSGKPSPLTTAPCCVLLTMDVKRMKEKGGERAERYCVLEVGHIAENLLLQATALGLSGVPMGGVDEARVATALKLSENLRPVYLIPVGHPKAK